MSGGRDLEGVLARFPKTRPVLPPKLQAIYTRQYIENRAGATPAASMSQRLERWLHRQVAADVTGRIGGTGATLEIGAGTLNQLAFEPANPAYDIVEPFEALYAFSAAARPHPDNLQGRGRGSRGRRLPPDHLGREPGAHLRSALGAGACGAPSGPGRDACTAIPSEGGFLWKLGWICTTGLEFRLRHGLSYGLMMAHEHVNDAREIETLIQALFEEVEVNSFGFGRQLSLYRFLAARRPRLDVAKAWEARFS